MDKYDTVRSAAEAARVGIADFADKFSSAIGNSLFDQDEYEDRFLYAMLDLIRDFNEITSGAVGSLRSRYNKFRDDALSYLDELQEGLDGDDPRREDLFWYDPSEHDDVELDDGEIVNYLEYHNFDDSYVKEELRMVKRHELFWSAIFSDCDESFFEEATSQSYAIKCLTDSEIED